MGGGGKGRGGRHNNSTNLVFTWFLSTLLQSRTLEGKTNNLPANKSGQVWHMLTNGFPGIESNGKDFPSKTIDLLLSGLKRYMVAQLKEKDPSICPVNFLSERDHHFAGLRGTRDQIAR